jgi:glycosyltransferase involved in cell wall biosynthesis
LEAIANQTISPFEVIVVDNNSTDKTVEVAQSFSFARVVKEKEQGIVFARNTGFDAAEGDIIGRIDADIAIPPRWIEHVQRFYADKNHRDMAWCGAGSFYNVRLARLVAWAYELVAFKLNRLLLGHYTLWGSNMALTDRQWKKVRAEVCSRTDVHEDLDLAIHLDQVGFGITYDPGLKVQAELRRVHSDRHKLWSYLNWMPRTYRIHHKKTWPFIWFVGVLLLYQAAIFLAFLDYAARLIQRHSFVYGRSPR